MSQFCRIGVIRGQGWSFKLYKVSSNIFLRSFRNLSTVKNVSTNSVKGQKLIGSWLLGCSGMIFGAVTLGGITRLTESGLSMTDWSLFGKLPPFSENEWLKEFSQYQEFPEYKQKNYGMTLDQFKFIWWMEYIHRQWGRTLGAIFLVPATFFWYKGWLKGSLKKRVSAIGILIGLQGLMGWYMVKSGLEDRFHKSDDIPRVSQYRLAAHLGLAFIVYSLCLWSALGLIAPAQAVKEVTRSARKFRMLAHTTKGFVFISAMSGAFVAGLDAGLVYNSFPKMADRWIPSDVLDVSPTWKNFTENPTTVQFDHRILGTVTLLLATTVAVKCRKVVIPPKARSAALLLGGMLWLQVGLGISTLLMYVPTWLAATHQSGSLVALSLAVWLTHELRHVKRVAK